MESNLCTSQKKKWKPEGEWDSCPEERWDGEVEGTVDDSWLSRSFTMRMLPYLSFHPILGEFLGQFLSDLFQRRKGGLVRPWLGVSWLSHPGSHTPIQQCLWPDSREQKVPSVLWALGHLLCTTHGLIVIISLWLVRTPRPKVTQLRDAVGTGSWAVGLPGPPWHMSQTITNKTPA